MINVKYATAVQLTVKAAERNFNFKKIVEMIEDKIEESVQKGIFRCEANIDKALFEGFKNHNVYPNPTDNCLAIEAMLNVIKFEFEKAGFKCEWRYYRENQNTAVGSAKFILQWGTK